MFKNLGFSLLINLFFVMQICKGQGCSDAGFCTMGAMRPNQFLNNKLDIRIKSIELSQYTGISHFRDLITAYQADINVGISKKLVAQLKLPYMVISGPLHNTHGTGDISISFTQNVLNHDRSQLNVTVGTKLPTNNSNRTDDGKSLPMYYQTSLGTYDIVFGASLIRGKWLFATGYQQPLTRNGNQFVWGQWADDDPERKTVGKYPISKNLKRGTDVMFRIERSFRYSRFTFFSGLLPIFRLNKDEAFIPSEGKIVKVKGSDGLALSLINSIGYSLSPKSSLRFLSGIRIIRREVNPDGLSREFVGTLGYQYRF